MSKNKAKPYKQGGKGGSLVKEGRNVPTPPPSSSGSQESGQSSGQSSGSNSEKGK